MDATVGGDDFIDMVASEPAGSLDMPAIMRRTGMTAEQIRSQAANAEWEMMKNKDAAWNKANADLPMAEGGPQKPLNTEALQKMLGDIFEPKRPFGDTPSPAELDAEAAYRRAVPPNQDTPQRRKEFFDNWLQPKKLGFMENVLKAQNDFVAQEAARKAAGHFDPPIQTVEDLQNMAMWGKTKGPWQTSKLDPTLGPPYQKVITDEGVTTPRQELAGQMEDVGRAIQEHLGRVGEHERRVNAAIRNDIMDETVPHSMRGSKSHMNVSNVASNIPQAFLRPNKGVTLNAFPPLAPTKKKGKS